MTAASSFAYSSMDLLHPEDTMDLASSPRMPADDLDLPYELDTMRDASAEPTQEEMIEDPTKPDLHTIEDVQIIDEGLLDDEDMVDEDTVVQNADANHEDFTMEPHQQTLPSAEHEDDDILYDDDEFVREGKIEAQDTQDVEIVDEEDLFHEDEEVREHSLEDTYHIPQLFHSNQDEEFLGEEQSTNMITQDTSDLGAMQGPPVSGDSANNTSDHNVDDQTKVEDGTNHKPNYELATDPEVSADTMVKPPSTTPTDTVDNPQISDSVEPAKVGQIDPQVDLSVAVAKDDLSQVEESEFPSRESESAQRRDRELLRHATAAGDEHFADHQSHTTPLHTVKVNYQDTEICLFPPSEDDDSETFFLEDVELAHQSLDKLLGACHDVLAGTIGDDDELVLDVPSLGLHIGQDSSYATRMTLSQILDVYLALSHNEQIEAVDPLYCHLSSRVSLASQYAYLLSAAEQGKTFAEIAAEHLHSHEGSLDDREEEYELNENHEDVGQDDRAEHGELEHKDTGTKNIDKEPVDQPQDSYADEGPTTDDVFTNDDASNSNALQTVPETDVEGVTCDAENEISATSTVRGDEQEPQDFETSHDDLSVPTNTASISGNYLKDTGEFVVSNDDALKDEDGKAETQSAVGDTESSRTVEVGDDAFEQALNADTKEERESFVHDPEDFYDNVNAKDPADAADGFGKTDELDQASGGLVQWDSLNGYDKDPHAVAQAVQRSANVTEPTVISAEFDDDDLLDLHGEERHEPFEHVAPLDPASRTAGKRSSSQDDLFDDSRSNGTAHKTESESSAVEVEDAFFLGEEDAEASVHALSPPTTPSKAKSSKRKIREDEDYFDLLDSGTPEIKRRRPS